MLFVAAHRIQWAARRKAILKPFNKNDAARRQHLLRSKYTLLGQPTCIYQIFKPSKVHKHAFTAIFRIVFCMYFSCHSSLFLLFLLTSPMQIYTKKHEKTSIITIHIGIQYPEIET